MALKSTILSQAEPKISSLRIPPLNLLLSAPNVRVQSEGNSCKKLLQLYHVPRPRVCSILTGLPRISEVRFPIWAWQVYDEIGYRL